MQVILLETGEMKNVSDGYARNYLFPRRLAVAATASAIKDAEGKHAAWQASQAADQAQLEQQVLKLKDVHLELTAKASEAGKLFAAVHTAEIVEALAKLNFVIKPEYVTIEPMKQVGSYTAVVALPKMEDVKIPVVITAA